MAIDVAKVPSGRQSLAKPTLVITLFTGLNLVSLFIFQAVLAAKFGVGREIDAFLTSNTVPWVIQMVVSSSLAFCLIPVFLEYQTTSGECEAWRIASSVLNLVGVLLFAATGISVGLAPLIVRLLAPGFDAAAVALTAALLRIQLWSVPFEALAALLIGICHAHYHFTLPAVAQVVRLGLMIVSLLLLEPVLGIRSAAFGVVLGGVVQFFMLVPLIARRGQYHWTFEWQHPGVRKIGQILGPLTLASVLYSGDLMVDRAIASGLPEGSIGYLGYAYRLMSRLGTLHFVGLSTTLFPLLGEYAAEKEWQAFQETLAKIFRILLFLTMPTAVGVALLSRPAVALLMERGQFSSQDTQVVASIMVLYLGMLFGQILISPLLRSFYALQDTTRPMVMAIVRFGTGIILRLLLLPWSFYGLAVALSICSIGNVAFGYVLMRRQFPGFKLGFTPLFLGKLLGCALVMALAVAGLQQLLGGGNWFSLPFTFLGGSGLFLMVALAWGLPEAHTVVDHFTAVVRRGR